MAAVTGAGTRAGPRWGRRLAIAALGLAALAPVVGSAGGPGGTGVAELSRELASGAPVIDAPELARRIRAREPFRLVDLRDSSAYVRLAVPTAENLGMPDLPRAVSPAETVVVYDDGDGTAVRAWLLLRRLGYERVSILDRGILGWVEGILDPVLPNETPAERARFRQVAELSRYFGGVPRAGRREPPGAGVSRAEDAIQIISRRGCY